MYENVVVTATDTLVLVLMMHTNLNSSSICEWAVRYEEGKYADIKIICSYYSKLQTMLQIYTPEIITIVDLFFEDSREWRYEHSFKMTSKTALSFSFAQIVVIFKLAQHHQSLNLKTFDNSIFADYSHIIIVADTTLRMTRDMEVSENYFIICSIASMNLPYTISRSLKVNH